VIVTGGLCPARGRPAPIGAYAQLAAEHRGWLVVDDTQALGILGTPDGRVPYGRGGGGSLRRAALRSKETVVVNSLAKAFGVPVAMLGGNAAFMANFRRRSLTRMHCSPPSAAVISAAGRAVEINRRLGDRLRWSLAMAVCRLRRGLDRLGVLANRSLFPVQPLRLFDGIEAAALHAALIERGVRTVLQRSPTARAARLSFILTARHGPEIDQAVESVADALRRGTSGQTKGVRGNYESAQFRGGTLWGVRRVAGREF
jgi:8-amino-7-oxononanoate synthase